MTTLDYQALTKRRLGPVFVRPSGRTVALVLLFAVCFAWVSGRHEPWVLVGKVPWRVGPTLGPDPTRSQGLPTFTPDNLFLTLAPDRTLRLYDPSTARHVRTLWSFTHDHVSIFVLRDGAELLILDVERSESLLLDTRTAEVVRRTMDFRNVEIPSIQCNRDASRVILHRWTGPPRTPLSQGPLGNDVWFPTNSEVWDLSRAGLAGAHAPMTTFPDPIATLTPDGTLIIRGEKAYVRAADFREVRFRRRRQLIFARRGSYVVSMGAASAAPQSVGHEVIEVHRLDTGDLVASVPMRLSAQAEIMHTAASHDGTGIIIEVHDPGRGARVEYVASLTDARFELRELAWNAQSLVIDFLPRSTLLVEARHGYPAPIICERLGGPVLATPLRSGWYPSTGSPDGAFIASDFPGDWGSRALYRRGPAECRMSRFGILGMPHVGLLIVAFVGLALSLAGDARRRRGRGPGDLAAPPRLVEWGLGIPAAAASLLLVLSLALGQRPPWALLAAPGVLLALTFSLTGSRLWRGALLAALALKLAASLDHLRRHAGLDPRAWSVHQLLDRRYPMPDVTLPALHAAAAGLALAGLLVVARRRAGRAHQPRRHGGEPGDDPRMDTNC